MKLGIPANLEKIHHKRNPWIRRFRLKAAETLRLFETSSKSKEHAGRALAFLTDMLDEEHSESLRAAHRIASLPRSGGLVWQAENMITQDQTLQGESSAKIIQAQSDE